MQVEVDAPAQQLLDVSAGLRADLLEPRTLSADDDGLLGVTLDIDVHVNVKHRRAVVALATRPFDDLLDLDGQGVRQLVAHALQGGLADEFGDEGVTRLVGDVAVGIERGRERHSLGEHLTQVIDALAFHGRNGDDGRPLPQLLDRQQVLHDAVARHGVALGRHRDDRALDAAQLAGDELVAGADALVGGQAEEHDVNLGKGLAHHVVEALAQQRARTVVSGSVHEHQLVVIPVHDAANVVTRGLGAARGDRDLASDQRVRQGRLADVGAADDRHEAGTVILGEVRDFDGRGRVLAQGCERGHCLEGVEVGILLVLQSLEVFILIVVLVFLGVFKVLFVAGLSPGLVLDVFAEAGVDLRASIGFRVGRVGFDLNARVPEGVGAGHEFVVGGESHVSCPCRRRGCGRGSGAARRGRGGTGSWRLGGGVRVPLRRSS